jgi:hypothetical protein
MTEPSDYGLFMLVLGGIVLLSVPLRQGLRRICLPGLIGASMVPRAEIYLVVTLHGLSLWAWATPQQLYSASVLAAICTCVIGPLMVARFLASSRPRGQTA